MSLNVAMADAAEFISAPINDRRRLLRLLQAWLEAELGGALLIGVELEFHVRCSTRMSLSSLADHCYHALRADEIPVKSISLESYPGQFEAVLGPERDATSVADTLVRIPIALTSILGEFNLCASFIAKPPNAEACNGMHVNLSVMNDEGLNLFSTCGQESHPNLLNHAIEGLCRVMNESMIFFCPNHSSYSRIVAARQSRCPESPSNVSWGGDNRTVALRVARGSTGPRLEHRVPGADADPYLTLAAILAGFGYGVRERLELSSPKVWGDAKADHPELPRLVATLADARQAFRESCVLRHLLHGHAISNS